MASSDPYLALDIGAGNGRATLGVLHENRIELQEIHRFENRPVMLNGTLYWDLLFLWDNVVHSLKRAAASGFSRLSGIGIDTFNCDFGLLDCRGNLLSNPLSYRDQGSASALGDIQEKIDEQELYEITGVGYMSITALARFVYMRKTFGHWYLDNAATYLPLSDLFGSFLTDRKESEETILWGSQLVDIRTRQWHPKLIDLFDIPGALLPDIVQPGTLRGGLKDAVEQETGVKATPVIAVAGHDTISTSVSFTDRAADAAFVSIGTWSILGVLLPGPETSPEAYRRGFLNEIGVDSILFAKNLMGFYLLEALIQSWKMREIDTTYERLIEEASIAPQFALSIDVNDPVFFSAVNMEETLNTYLHASGQRVTDEIGILVRSILESFARSYAQTIEDLEKIFKTRVARLTVLGGGVRNQLLCQMIADAADVKVVTGPAEATVVGNIGMQILATGALDSTQALRPIMERSSIRKIFRPENHGTWKEQAAGKEA
jgi:sugar (pentulose or hexulose) kinase